MKKFSFFIAVVAYLAATAAAQTKPSDDSTAPTLTIYNQNFFVARERLPLDLKPGVNHVDYAGVAAHLEPDSVILRDPAGRSLQILEQNYRNDPISQELLLSFYEGKEIDFSVGRTPEGKDVIVKGKVIRSGYIPSTYYAQNYQQPVSTQPIIEVDGILRFGMPGQPLFPALSADSILKPTLSWLLQTPEAGKFDAEISYVSTGMSWQADYNLVFSDKSNAKPNESNKTDILDMIGWITMRNQSGKTFENARIKLLAGDVNKIQSNAVNGRVYAMAKMADEAAAAPVVREKSFDEFHLYTLERPTTLHDEETKQVEFVRAPDIHAQRCPRASCASTAATPTVIWSSSAKTPLTTRPRMKPSASTPETLSTWWANASAPAITWIPTSVGWMNRSRSTCAITRRKQSMYAWWSTCTAGPTGSWRSSPTTQTRKMPRPSNFQ